MIEEIRSIEQLPTIAKSWGSLLLETPDASFFHHPQWLETYWRHYGEGQQLRLLVDRYEESIRGILPLVVTRESTRAGSVRLLTYPLAGWGTWYSPIGPHGEQTLKAGMRHIRSTPRDWDVLDLRWVKDSNWSPAFKAAGLPCKCDVWGIAPVVEFQTDWKTYWSTRKGKWRENVRRNERKLAQFGDVVYRRFRSDCKSDDIAQCYNDCLYIAETSWQSQADDGTTLSDNSVRSFLYDCHFLAAELGCLDANLIYVNNQPVAFAYNYVHNGSVVGIRMGYLEQVAKAGVGTVLMKRMIEDSFARGDIDFDLGLDNEHSKRYWQTGERVAWRYCHYPAGSIRAQALRLKRWFDKTFWGERPAMKS